MKPRLKPRLLLGLLAALLWLPMPSPAGTISLSTQVQASLRQGRLTVRVKLANQGDETARRLNLSALAGGSRVEAAGPARLEPGRPQRVRLEMPLSPTRPGTYPVLVRVQFHDANDYPFSSLAWGLFNHGQASVARLHLLGRPGQTYPGPAPGFVLISRGDKPQAIGLRVYAPGELSLQADSFQIDLAPGRKRVVAMGVSNRGGLKEASYPLVGLATYQQDGVHYTVAAQALVKIGPSRDPLFAWRPWLWALAGLLLAALLAAWLRERRKGRAA